MTNKTREELKKEYYKRFGDVHKCRRDIDPYIFEYCSNDIWSWIETRVIKQPENRILRKWKKAIDKILYSYPLLDEFYRRMNEEYLKAKKEINK